MNKSTKYLLVLVGTVALFALALSFVAPALAQDGTAATPEAGATVTLEDADTLGDVVDRFGLSGDDVRNFFLLNSGVVLDAGQTITYPAGITVDTSGQGQVTSTTVTDAQLLEFVTLNRDLEMVDGQSVVLPAGVPATGVETTPAATVEATVEATATQAASAELNTYVTQEGDTLGEVMGFMGFQAGIPATGADTTATATEAAGGAVATATPVAGGTDATATATPAAGGTDATATATPAAGGTDATATPVAGCEASYTIVAGDTLTAIAERCNITLEQLVAANPDLLDAGETLNIPAATGGTTGHGTTGEGTTAGNQGNIPQTGGAESEVDFGVGGNASLNLDLMPDTVQAGRGVYVVRSGDSLSSIARRFDTTVEWLLENNRGIPNANLIFRGQRLVVPQGEVTGWWNYQDLERAANPFVGEGVSNNNADTNTTE